MARGGTRPGAGRKTKASKYAPKINAAEKKIADRLPVLVDRLFDLAEGVVVEEVDDGETNVYSKPPDFKSLEYLLNRIMGKPTERQEIEAEVKSDVSGKLALTFDELAKLSPDELAEQYRRALGKGTAGSQ